MDAVTIANMALASIGAQSTVSSINPSDGSVEGNLLSLIYQQKVDTLSRAVHWNCLRKQAPLTVVKAAAGTPENPAGASPTPPIPWTYSYALPPDCLKARFILPYVNSAVISPPLMTGGTNLAPPLLPAVIGAVKFAVAFDTDALGNPARVILTNMAQAQLVYTARVADPNMWDAHFIEAFIATLASWAVDGLARNRALSIDKAAQAKEIIVMARVSDGNEGPTVTDHTPDWIAIRGVPGDFIGGGIYYMGWDTIAFPGLPAF